MPEKKITREELKHIAKGVLLDFKELPGFQAAEIGEIFPIYSVKGKKIEYYEVKFSSPENRDNGYAVISATNKDYPVVEFSEKGVTHSERFQSMLGTENFKMVRFGPNYITAEDQNGRMLAEIGNRPVIIPQELRKHFRNEGKAETGKIAVSEPPKIISERKGKPSRIINYQTFKKRYQKPEIKKEKLEKAWERALKPRGNPGCQYDYYWADGFYNHPYYLQIPKNTPPNNNDYWSGCGATAWMNLCGWHDLNWTPNLLNSSTKYNSAYIKNLTMACHNYIGTYEPWWTFGADQGFTWPEDMPKGYNFVREYFGHACSYWYRYDWWNTDEEWVFEVARDVIRNMRPFIVGYFQDWHYAIGYGVAECRTHGWEEHSWIKIYPAWSENDSDNKWIPKSTIFAIYGVYSFFPLLQFVAIENPQELEVVVNGPLGANRLFVYTGIGIFNSAGATGPDWMRGSISFEVGRVFSGSQFKKAVASVSLASIANEDHAVNAGWAIDRVDAQLASSGKIALTLNYAIRDIDGYLYRVGYRVSVLAEFPIAVATVIPGIAHAIVEAKRSDSGGPPLP